MKAINSNIQAYEQQSFDQLFESHTSPVDLASLNKPQREAVLCTEGPLLVLAGAGSGKTRVLTQRIAHLISDKGVHPSHILAITFTNKAAGEMRERLESLLGSQISGYNQGVWALTFHAFCVRMLRAHAERIGYQQNFTIYDSDDSNRLIKQVMSDLDIDTTTGPNAVPPKFARSQISNAKNKLVGPVAYSETADNFRIEQVARVYREYDRRLSRANAMDFDDLLVKALELLQQHPDVLAAYQDRFTYILVDEYQDTNHVQYQLTNLLASKTQNLMVVGDDDQSIYSWRGADIKNILAFEQDYPHAKIIKLEQNYRSTGHILSAANAVVANNSRRKAKRLFTDLGDGEKVALYQASDERDEGRWIGGEIERLHDSGVSYEDMAVFYRLNSQSRVLEDMFLRAGVPYKIAGGTRYYDRAEIRDLMAYIKLILNPADDVSLERVINTPRRGIGKTSLDTLRMAATTRGVSMYEACRLANYGEVAMSSKALVGVSKFVEVIERSRSMVARAAELSARANAGAVNSVTLNSDTLNSVTLNSDTLNSDTLNSTVYDLRELISDIIDASGLLAALEAEHTVEADSRIENIREFLTVAEDYVEHHRSDNGVDLLDSSLAESPLLDNSLLDNSLLDNALLDNALLDNALLDNALLDNALADNALADNPLANFMEWVALRSDLDSLSGQSQSITMMTVHSAKGLEFPVVFITGMEDGIFPHIRFGEDAEVNYEEERRLAYVAITRARKQLYITYTTARRMFGSDQHYPKSRFIKEIPREHLRPINVGSDGFQGVGWEKRGDRHGTYGSGRGNAVYGGRVFGSITRSTPKKGSLAAGVTGLHGEVAAKRGTATSSGSIYNTADHNFKRGDRVVHKTFGPGQVTEVQGDKISVVFSRTGKKKQLLKDLAPIVKLPSE